ncbi:MAG: hypothetical protein ACRD0L_09925 [Acidimicrobiales bacterium]
MTEAMLRAWLWQREIRVFLVGRIVPGERGEGVISAAIAVLIMAFLGVALWVAFKATLGAATSNVNNQISQIGK